MDFPSNPLITQCSRHRQKQLPVHILVLLLCACSDAQPRIAPLPQDAVVLAFGDSLTWGTGTAREHSYPAWLEHLIKRRVVNAGIPGEQSAQGRARLPRLLEEHQPDLLILCHGGNDLLRRIDAAETRENLVSMIDQAERRGVPVILIGVPQPGLIFLEAAPLYDKIAAEYSLPYDGNVLPEIVADNALKSDQIHPNAKGYRAIAEAIYRLLEASGALP